MKNNILTKIMIALIFILAATAGYFLWNFWNLFPVSITVQSPWVLAEGAEPQTWQIRTRSEIRALQRALANSKDVSGTELRGPGYTIVFHNRNNSSLSYQLWVDAYSLRAFVRGSDHISEISAQNTEYLLRLDAFSDAYLDEISPLSLQIMTGAELISCLPGSISMLFQTLDGQKQKNASASPPLPVIHARDWEELSALTPALADRTQLICYGDHGESIIPVETGEYLVKGVVSYGKKTDGRFIGAVTYSFTLVLLPKPEAFLAESTLLQGDLGCVAVKNLRPMEEYLYRVHIPYLNRDLTLEPSQGVAACLFEVPNTTDEGVYEIEVFAQKTGLDPSSALPSWEKVCGLPLTIEKKPFTRQNLTATPSMSALNTEENSRADQIKIQAAIALGQKSVLWRGPFIMPATARISTQYGEERYTNGRFTSRHNALDIAAPLDTPVLAAAAGKVVLADDLILSGKAVYIDHGAGLFSNYLHLNQYSVEVGQYVSQGQVIGYVGSTGYSTGPHLHFAVMLGTAPVDPNYLIKIDPMTAALIQCW